MYDLEWRDPLEKTDIHIRAATEEDRDSIRHIITEAFSVKFTHITDLPAEDVMSIVCRYIPITEGTFVAEIAGDITGVITLSWKGQVRPQGKKQDTLKGSGLTVWEKLKLMLAFSLFNHRPRADECYIDFIAVDADHRGQKIGSTLLDHGEDIAKKKSLKYYTLYVAATNSRAEELYHHYGFSTITTVNSRFSRWLTDIQKWHFMRKQM